MGVSIASERNLQKNTKRLLKGALDRSDLKKVLYRAGLYVRMARSYWPLDWSETIWSHPLEAIFSGKQRDVLLTVPLDRVRFQRLHGFPAQREGFSPFIRSIRDYLDGRCTTYSGSALEAFYATYRPRAAADYIQLIGSSNRWFHKMPATAGVEPWGAVFPNANIKRCAAIEERDSREHGRRLGLADGFRHFGPVSLQKGELEYSRLIKITDSICRNGFYFDRQGLDNISGAILLDGNEYRFLIGNGHHRIAALAALGFDAVIQIRSGAVVRRSDARFWPIVQQRWYTEEEALSIFDRIFQGRGSDSSWAEQYYGQKAIL